MFHDQKIFMRYLKNSYMTYNGNSTYLFNTRVIIFKEFFSELFLYSLNLTFNTCLMLKI